MPSARALRERAELRAPCPTRECRHEKGDHRPIVGGGAYCYVCQERCPR